MQHFGLMKLVVLLVNVFVLLMIHAAEVEETANTCEASGTCSAPNSAEMAKKNNNNNNSNTSSPFSFNSISYDSYPGKGFKEASLLLNNPTFTSFFSQIDTLQKLLVPSTALTSANELYVRKIYYGNEMLFYNAYAPIAIGKAQDVLRYNWNHVENETQMLASAYVSMLKQQQQQSHDNSNEHQSLVYSSSVANCPILTDSAKAAVLHLMANHQTDMAEVLFYSSQDVHVRTQFSMDDIYLVQVAGKMNVAIYPPAAWDQLKLYPKIHPHWLHGQVAILTKGTERRLLKNNHPESERKHFTLMPGDVLFIPAFFFYRLYPASSSVDAPPPPQVVSPSIQLKLKIKDTIVYDQLDAILGNAFPFANEDMRAEFGEREIDSAALETTRNVILQLFNNYRQTRMFLENILHTQFYPFMKMKVECPGPFPRGSEEGSRLESAEVEAIQDTVKRFRAIENFHIRQIAAFLYMQGTGMWLSGLGYLPEYIKCMSETFWD